MPKVILRSAAVVLFFFAAAWLSQPASAQASATDLVERLNSTLLEVMQGADNLGSQGPQYTDFLIAHLLWQNNHTPVPFHC